MYTQRYRGWTNTRVVPPMPALATRTVNLRIDDDRRELIDRAAEAVGKDRTAFMLEAATSAAESVLLDRRVFKLDPSAWDKLNAILDAAPADSTGLRALFSKRAPWER